MDITSERTRPARTFWWDRARPIDADVSPLRAVIFDADALADLDRDGDVVPRAGLIDLVMSLFVAGIWVGVVSAGRRDSVEPLVRQVVGEGLVETIVTCDDLVEPGRDAELYQLASWELGIAHQSALAVVGTRQGLRAAVAAGLPAVVVTADYTAGQDFTGAAAVRAGYDGSDPLLVAGCRRLSRRWWIAEKSSLSPAAAFRSPR